MARILAGDEIYLIADFNHPLVKRGCKYIAKRVTKKHVFIRVGGLDGDLRFNRERFNKVYRGDV